MNSYKPHFVQFVTILVLMLSTFELAVAALPSRRVKDLAYTKPDSKGHDPERHLLDVYTPRRKGASLLPVVVFIHGGSWNSGRKNMYTFIGRRLAKQDVVGVIINYRLAPSVEVPAMADDCAQAVRWVSEHITEYGGDPSRIFVMGHSAGGGLAGLLATDDALFTRLGLPSNPVRGAILNDPAGLDMFDYLTKQEYPGDAKFLIPFGKKPDVWRQVSPFYYITKSTPPMLLYIGERTYPSIQNGTRKFAERLKESGVWNELKQLSGKKHVPMVTQLFWKNNVIYRDLLAFVNKGR